MQNKTLKEGFYMADLKMIRIEKRLKELFNPFIDCSDCPVDSKESSFKSRAIASIAIMLLCNIDEATAARAVTDGSGDMGIDAIFCDNSQKELVLVQSKWSQDGKGTIGVGDLLKFIEGVKSIISLEFSEANGKILQRKTEIDKAIRDMDYKIKLVVCHTGDQSMSLECKKRMDDFLSSINDDSNELLIFTEIVKSEIYDYLASGQSADRVINIDDVVLHNWGKVESPYSAFYGTIKGTTLAEWYQKYGTRLFDRNIRFYKGNTEVNDGIRRVLEEEPQNFYYYNNGLKALCSNISRKVINSTDTKTGLFSIEGLALVNGAQTTGVIGTVYLEKPDQLKNVDVMIQLISLEGTPAEYDAQITKFSNTQNRIENKDFASLDPEQDRLAKELTFENIEYLYKSGSNIRLPETELSIDEAIVGLACFHDDITMAATAKRNVGALVENVNKAPYKALFNSGTSGFTLWNCVRIMRRTDKFLKEQESGYQSKERLALVHGNRFMLHMVFCEFKKNFSNFTSDFVNTEVINKKTEEYLRKLIPLQISAMSEVYPEAYPAHIFKNVGRCRIMKDKMNE